MSRGAPWIKFALVAAVAIATTVACRRRARSTTRFTNAYDDPGDDGSRAGLLYSLHRAWGEIVRDAASTQVPATIELNLAEMATRSFAVSWIGHASLLVRVGGMWVLIDPVFGTTAGPMEGLGPRRLTALPIGLDTLPHIDLVLISHDHFDHLHLGDIRRLCRQAGGPPRFYAGSGLRTWFLDHAGVAAEELDWWASRREGELELTFIPAQHSSGRSLIKNRTLWGGWALRYAGHRFYFAGDTAYAAELFEDIHARLGSIDVAALPIGAYLPRALMRYEHMNPQEAVRAHRQLDARQSFGVHWGTFQLGDERPMAASSELMSAARESNTRNFGVATMGAIIDVAAAAASEPRSLQPPIASSVPSVSALR